MRSIVRYGLVILFGSFSLLSHQGLSQNIPSDRVVSPEDLYDLLTPDVQKELGKKRTVTTEVLAAYFRTKYSQRYFFDYREVESRLKIYNELYGNEEKHRELAMDHIGKYNDSTRWKLPFDYKNGAPVNAYAMRHLARQHKMVDIAFHYFNDGKDPKYIKYFENQMRSLNYALETDNYETIEDGNGVYEAFRSGYRVLNWLWIHSLFLNEDEYSDYDQLMTISTLLQHGAHLYERNDTFRPGNHQTRGVSALAMLSILFQDFIDTDLWLDRAMQRLNEHLEREINKDGFQFERSVHYHMSDVGNFFYVYRLAQISNVQIDPEWENKLKSLFETLVKIGYPDRSAPVLQDDTEIPWAEANDISGTMTLGYLLFEEPTYGYFASGRVKDGMYWFLSSDQVSRLSQIESKKPTYGSLHFPDTKYYIMREGWDKNDMVMVISAGVDSEKPDHQHGDILGIQAMAYGKPILPNYQVRYSLKDFQLFKNSLVKNVGLVDEELQGKKWTGNKGGSGFGKFRELPNPKTIAWETTDDLDVYIGSHDGFSNVGVDYSRQVLFVKDEFWVVKDNYKSDKPHTYVQQWQGHYTQQMTPNLLRRVYEDASGADILQLNNVDGIEKGGSQGKHWVSVKKQANGDFEFLSIIYPYKGYDKRIDEYAELNKFGSWVKNNSGWEMEGNTPVSLTSGEKHLFFNVKSIKSGQITISSSIKTDLFVKSDGPGLTILLIGASPVDISLVSGENERTFTLKPGESKSLE